MMTHAHPLDRPVWNALATRQRALALGNGRARRFRPEINLFAAAKDRSMTSLLALSRFLQGGAAIGLVEAQPFPPIPGARIEKQVILNQMVATGSPGVGAYEYLTLADADAPEMLALATLTAPGPFYAETYRMGDFIGVRRDGQLAAMAGQRMRVPGLTEISAVCTHPDHRGQGHAGRLMRVLIDCIVRQGEAAFLHVYPDNVGAIGLYETLGFRFRSEINFTVLTRS